MADGAPLASDDPKTNGLLSVFNADPKVGTSGLAAADPNDVASGLGADAAPNDKPSGFATEGDPNVDTSGFIIGEPKAGTSELAIDDPNDGTTGLTADEEPKDGVSVFEGAPNVNIFEGVVVAVELTPPKLGVAEIVEAAGFPNTNALDGADSALAGAPKAGFVGADAVGTPNEKLTLPSSVLDAAGGVLTGAGKPNTGAGAEDGGGFPNVGGVDTELLVADPNVRPVEVAVAVFAAAGGAETPNENVDVGADVVAVEAAVEIEVGLIPKLKVLSFLSTSSLAGVVDPKPKEKLADG